MDLYVPNLYTPKNANIQHLLPNCKLHGFSIIYVSMLLFIIEKF